MKKLLTALALCAAASAFAQPYPISYKLEDNKGRTLANTKYRLYFNTPITITRAPNEAEIIENQIIHGVTDGDGFTSVILVDEVPDEKDIVLIRRYGEGHYGIIFQLTTKSPGSDPNQPLPYQKFRVIMCGKTKVVGYTDKNGQTPYYSSSKPCNATIEVPD